MIPSKSNWLLKILKRHKLRKITPHGLRHSNGTDIKNLQDWLGHCNISSTNIYTHSEHVSTGNIINSIFNEEQINMPKPKMLNEVSA